MQRSIRIEKPTDNISEIWVIPNDGFVPSQHWMIMQWHREDGPAISKDDGSMEWWVKNKRHRLDGPAVKKYLIDVDDFAYMWFINGKNITREIDRLAEENSFDKFNIGEDGQLFLTLKYM